MRILKLMIAAILLANALTEAANPKPDDNARPWCYSNECGPDQWAQLSQSYQLCGMGEAQSPVDIHFDKTIVDSELSPIMVGYEKGVSCSFFSTTNSPYVRGRQLEMKVFSKAAGSISKNHVQYFFDRATVHVPSEHMLNGKQADMELQFWHVDERMRKLRVSMLYSVNHAESHEENKVLTSMIAGFMDAAEADLGKGKKASIVSKTPVNLKAFFDSLADGKDLRVTTDTYGKTKLESYLFYDGSSTTPPCAEDVKWVIVPDAGHISDDQVDALRYALDTTNDRPPQQLFRRSVYRRPSLVGTPSWSYHPAKAPERPKTRLDGWMCKNGKHQSPINIDDAELKKSGPAKDRPSTVYHRAAVLAMVTQYMDQKSSLLKPNRYGIYDEFDPGSSLSVQGRQYKLKKLTVYAPGLHQFNGETFDMEMHMEHESKDGKLMLVVPVKSGAVSDPIFKKLINGTKFNPTELLPKDPNYYMYDGSELTGGCDEGVKWVVMQSPMVIASGDMAKYFERMPSTRYRREPQPLNKRILIKTSFPKDSAQLGENSLAEGGELLKESKVVPFEEE